MVELSMGQVRNVAFCPWKSEVSLGSLMVRLLAHECRVGPTRASGRAVLDIGVRDPTGRESLVGRGLVHLRLGLDLLRREALGDPSLRLRLVLDPSPRHLAQ